MRTQNNGPFNSQMHVVSKNEKDTALPAKLRITMADSSQSLSLREQFSHVKEGVIRWAVHYKYRFDSLTFGIFDKIGFGKIVLLLVGTILILAWRSKTVSETTQTVEAGFTPEAKSNDDMDWKGIMGAKNTSKSANSTSLSPAAVSELNEKMVLDYIERYHKVAITEMDKFGIPASISLAQGLIESRSGTSILARKNNNHFGMKCFSKKCPNGHCSNHTDDHHKDFFRIYKNSWESWREHSKMLMNGRYRVLQKYAKDYRRWAHGLRELGYATDKTYDTKLIGIIEKFQLNKFDEL